MLAVKKILRKHHYDGIGGGVGGAGGAEVPLNKNLGGGGSAPPRFGPENIGNAAAKWFGKTFQLEIFPQIV